MIEFKESDDADEVKEADEANEVDKANEVDVANKIDADEANDSNEVNKAKSNEVGVSVELPLLLPFSLTKYCAIFAEVKGSFERYNNQLGGLKEGCLSPCSLMIPFVRGIRESIFKNI